MPIAKPGARTVACFLLTVTTTGTAWPADCRPAISTPAIEVLRACGEPKKRYAVRVAGMDIVHREWDYGDTIVGLIDERVAYVLDMKD